MSTVSVIDYGMGNIGSVKNILKYLGYKSNTIYTAKEVAKADNIILPGVGNFKMAVRNIKKLKLIKH